MNHAAVIAGTIRAASGISFLVAPDRAQAVWSSRPAEDPTARLLLRSMGYRDALVGGGLLVAGRRGTSTVPRWFLASAGADAADLLGGWDERHGLSERDHVMGLGGAAAGIAVGLLGAFVSWRTSNRRTV